MFLYFMFLLKETKAQMSINDKNEKKTEFSQFISGSCWVPMPNPGVHCPVLKSNSNAASNSC